MDIMDGLPSTMPKDRDQRWRLVREMRRRTDEADRLRKSREASKFRDGVADNIDRGWSSLGRRVLDAAPRIAGFGTGQTGYSGKYVMRGGELVRA